VSVAGAARLSLSQAIRQRTPRRSSSSPAPAQPAEQPPPAPSTRLLRWTNRETLAAARTDRADTPQIRPLRKRPPSAAERARGVRTAHTRDQAAEGDGAFGLNIRIRDNEVLAVRVAVVANLVPSSSDAGVGAGGCSANASDSAGALASRRGSGRQQAHRRLPQRGRAGLPVYPARGLCSRVRRDARDWRGPEVGRRRRGRPALT
jgi:hypothetical protein